MGMSIVGPPIDCGAKTVNRPLSPSVPESIQIDHGATCGTPPAQKNSPPTPVQRVPLPSNSLIQATEAKNRLQPTNHNTWLNTSGKHFRQEKSSPSVTWIITLILRRFCIRLHMIVTSSPRTQRI